MTTRLSTAITTPSYHIGLSTDTKPTSDRSGSRFLETDTMDQYLFDESATWVFERNLGFLVTRGMCYDAGTLSWVAVTGGTATGTKVEVTNLPSSYPVEGGNTNAVKVDGSAVTQPVSGTLAVTGPLTDTELRASPVPVNIDSLDNTSLFSGTISATGPGTAINMTGYQSLTVQLSGVWAGVLLFESSNDNSNWDVVLCHSRDDVAILDQIDQNGLYSIRASGKYLRYNVTNITGTITAVMLGKTLEVLSPSDKLAFAMDKHQNLPLFVEQSNPPLKDVLGAQIPSDAPNAILFQSNSVAQGPLTIDTTGYQSIVIHKITASGIITPTTSNDGLTWYGVMGATATAPYLLTSTLPAAAGVYVFPVTGKFFRLTGPASYVQAIVYLRQAPVLQSMTENLAYVGGTLTVTAGLAGMLAVGGNVASGVAPTANPVQIGGVDAGRLNTPGAVAANLTAKTRRALVDELGRFIPPNIDLSTSLNFENSTHAWVRDTAQHEGQSLIEILYHILVEMRVLNHQIHELGAMNPAGDLDDMRKEMKQFNYNN